jgi:uroporphyrinogen decarboxylase
MTSKERVKAAMARQPVDRIPIFMWFHPGTTQILAGLLEIPPSEVGGVMGNDVCQRWVAHNHAMEGIVHERDGEGHTDFWGVEWERVDGFNQIRRYPLQGASPAAVDAYPFPYDKIPDLLSNMDALAPFAETHFIGCDVSPCVFEMFGRLFGMEDAMYQIADASPEFLRFVRRSTDFMVELSEQACKRYAMDWFWTGDDVGGQRGMMMSPDMWRELIKPELARVYGVGQKYGHPVAYHSCGGIRPIIPDLIEIGLNVLNPIQCDCPGMDAAELKKDFGKHLTFMGGVDTIDLLPNGSPDDVCRATRQLLDVMTADGGGYILAASHTVAPETPIDNIFAMYHEAGITRESIFDAAADIRKRRNE